MKKIILLLLVITIFSGCARSISNELISEESTTRDITESYTENLNTISDSPTVVTPSESTENPKEVVIECMVVRSALTSFDNIVELYMKKYPHVTVAYFEYGNGHCISSCANDEVDLAIITRDLNEEEKQMDDFELSTFYRSGLAFIVNKDNPISNLSREQVVDIYEKEITNWSELGGEKGDIVLYSVNDSLMGHLARSFNVDDYEFEYGEGSEIFMFRPELLLKEYPQGITGMLVGNLEEYQEIKAVSIDGIAPTYDNVKSGEYPYYIDAMLITKSDVSEEVQKFIEFCTSDTEVLEYLKEEGYVIP